MVGSSDLVNKNLGYLATLDFLINKMFLLLSLYNSSYIWVLLSLKTHFYLLGIKIQGVQLSLTCLPRVYALDVLPFMFVM